LGRFPTGGIGALGLENDGPSQGFAFRTGSTIRALYGRRLNINPGNIKQWNLQGSWLDTAKGEASSTFIAGEMLLLAAREAVETCTWKS
jgi:hypothetical protein